MNKQVDKEISSRLIGMKRNLVPRVFSIYFSANVYSGNVANCCVYEERKKDVRVGAVELSYRRLFHTFI